MSGSYQEIKPAAALADCIDAYWTVQTGLVLQPGSRRIYPDGCIDIIINTGSLASGSGTGLLLPGRQYLAGTMTVVKEVVRMPHNHVTGIRFRPGGFTLFYHEDLPALRDDLVEFHDPQLALLIDRDEQVFERLDRYYSKKLPARESAVVAMARSMYGMKGLVSVDQLARLHHVTHRTLERLFKKHTGITAKEMTKIVRFRFAMERLKNNPGNESLLRIAFETGYYDHAHLTNEIRKYAGVTPSQLSGSR